MTSVTLPEKYMLELIYNIKRSQSLHCVHLCGNKLPESCVELINTKLKPTFINEMIAQDKLEMKRELVKKIKMDILQNYSKRYEKIYDSVKFKDVMLETKSVQQAYHQTKNLPGGGNNDNYFMPLILSKQLGHPEIKNSKHWKITNECYICDKWKYTIIFWDMKKLGTKF